MNKKKIINLTEEFLKIQLDEDEPTGHDFWHANRVRNLALYIANNIYRRKLADEADIFVIELAALLHDVADWKFHGGDQEIGPKKAEKWLESINVDHEIIFNVCNIIKGISFKGAGVSQIPLSLEGQIVQDADRLDALGAIGIARAFAYGGYKKQVIYNPTIAPMFHKTVDEYLQRKSSTINHFHEKLLLLKDRMNTQIAKEIATERHQQMLNFLEQFTLEWDFKKLL